MAVIPHALPVPGSIELSIVSKRIDINSYRRASSRSTRWSYSYRTCDLPGVRTQRASALAGEAVAAGSVGIKPRDFESEEKPPDIPPWVTFSFPSLFSFFSLGVNDLRSRLPVASMWRRVFAYGGVNNINISKVRRFNKVMQACGRGNRLAYR